MKKFKVLSGVLMVLIVGFLAMQCQHEDGEAIPVQGPDPIEHGDQIANCTGCDTDTGVPGSWFIDQNHSNVMWETQYKAFGSKLTGRFDSFFLTSLNFDEGVPSNIAFDGHVWLNSVNTSEPGRDDGCLLTTFGTDADNTTEDANKATLVSIAGSGRYSSTDAGFLVDANFTFLGITEIVTVKIFFAPKFSAGATEDAIGLNSVFEIAKADFLPNDSNIGDVIQIEVNTLIRVNK
jgi:polyisoprenoid-binding protein YceI